MYPIGNGFMRRIGQGVSRGTGYSRNVSDWRLATNDTAAAVEAANFFNARAKDLVLGAFIYASLDLDGAPAGKIYMVTANTGTVVTVAAV